MIDFTAKQLSWIVLTATGIGGGGYLTMNSKVDELDKKVAVSVSQLEYTNKSMDRLEKQLNRIEEKIDAPAVKR